MRVLRARLGLVNARLAGIVVLAVAAADKAGGGGGRLVGESQRVGTHIGDQTGKTVLTQLDASYSSCAMLMVRRGVMFSLRLASCWRVEVMNGGAGVRFFLPRLISPTVNAFR